MASNPKVFGVEMRRSRIDRTMWTLRGCQLWEPSGSFTTWSWCVWHERGHQASQASACRAIERAIARIRDAAGKLGT
jgi:hypothetical protein